MKQKMNVMNPKKKNLKPKKRPKTLYSEEDLRRAINNVRAEEAAGRKPFLADSNFKWFLRMAQVLKMLSHLLQQQSLYLRNQSQ